MAFLSAFAPDGDALLSALAPRVTEMMLREIAAADYGYGLEENLTALQAIKAGAPVGRLRPNLREVLELTRWTEPDWDDGARASKGEVGHWIRAFACAALLRANGEPEGEGWAFADNDTLIPLTLSLDRLDAQMDKEARALIAWRIASFGEQASATAFFGVALLWFSLRDPAIADEALIALCEWIDGEEKRAAAEGPLGAAEIPRRWLLSTTSHGQRHYGWEALGQRLAAHDLKGRGAAVRDWVRLIGAALAGAEA